MPEGKHKVTWIDMKREPQCDPDPAYPNGKFIDASLPGMDNCIVDLPYPAPRIGHYEITCSKCGKRVFVTTAGRPDDPTGIAFPCKRRGANNTKEEDTK